MVLGLIVYPRKSSMSNYHLKYNPSYVLIVFTRQIISWVGLQFLDARQITLKMADSCV